MFLTGYIKVDGQLSYLAWKDIKATECLWTFSPYHADEIYDVELGKIPEYPVISSPMVLKEFYNEDYLLGILKRTKVSGKITCYGQNQQNELMLDTLAFARNYTFDKNGVCQNESSAVDGGSASSSVTSPDATGTTVVGSNVTTGTSTPSAGAAPGTSTTTPSGTSSSSGVTVADPSSSTNAPGSTTPTTGTAVSTTAPGAATSTTTTTTTGTVTSVTAPGATTTTTGSSSSLQQYQTGGPG